MYVRWKRQGEISRFIFIVLNLFANLLVTTLDRHGDTLGFLQIADSPDNIGKEQTQYTRQGNAHIKAPIS